MEASLTSVGVYALFGLGFLFGLKHATEVDHVVAVSTIVSEHRNIWRSALVGGLWGVGHSVSLVIVGMLVLVFRLAISMQVSKWLEFGVALMIITLGVLAVVRVMRRRQDVHLHRHSHDGQSHAHVHFHEPDTEHRNVVRLNRSHSHSIRSVGFRPLLVGAMHGLAGSAALTLLVLTQIPSVLRGLVYLGVFGFGSTLGMLLMSGLIGIPFALSGKRLTKLNYGMQTVAGCLSILIGLWYAYRLGFTK